MIQDERVEANDESGVPASDNELTAEQTLSEQLEEQRAKADDYKDKYLRSLAEFDNYRKRIERDRERDTILYKMDVLRRLLPVVDDFDRALKHVSPELAENDWLQGIALVARNLHGLLESLGVVPMEVVGKPFDPNYHSALIQEPSDEHPVGTVMEEYQRGYLLADQVLRPATVIVSSGPKSRESD